MLPVGLRVCNEEASSQHCVVQQGRGHNNPAAAIVVAHNFRRPRQHFQWLRDLTHSTHVIMYAERYNLSLLSPDRSWTLVRLLKTGVTMLECEVYFRHIQLWWHRLHQLTFFLQDDSEDREFHPSYYRRGAFHASDIATSIAAICNASTAPSFMPLSDIPIGRTASLYRGKYDVWQLHALQHASAHVAGGLSPTPDSRFAWKNGLFVASATAIRHSISPSELNKTAAVVSLDTQWCHALERAWQDIFGGCGSSWTDCSCTTPSDCGSCMLEYAQSGHHRITCW